MEGSLKRKLPDRREVRELLDSALKTESDWSAFVMDSFPKVSQKFTQGMDRTEQTNLLLRLGDEEKIIDKLRQHLKPGSGRL